MPGGDSILARTIGGAVLHRAKVLVVVGISGPSERFGAKGILSFLLADL
jgi:hypothetical protein